jgi:hypothetical protein
MYRPTRACRRKGTPSREPRSDSHSRASERVGAERILAARLAVRADERARGFGNERIRTSQAPRGPGASPSQAQDLLRAWAGRSDQTTQSPANLLMTQARDRACATGEAPGPRGAWAGSRLSNIAPYVVILVTKMHASFGVTAFAQVRHIRLWLVTVLTVLSINAGLSPRTAQSAILLSPAWLQLQTSPEALAHSRTNPTPQPRLSSANSSRTSRHGDSAQAAAPSSHAPSAARSLAKEGERAQRSVAERARGGGISTFGRRTPKSYDDKITEYIWDGDDLIHERTTDKKTAQAQPLTT